MLAETPRELIQPASHQSDQQSVGHRKQPKLLEDWWQVRGAKSQSSHSDCQEQQP
jgi:hypothetical protein